MLQAKSTVKGIKGKVLLALFLACIALITAWGVSNTVFNKMLNTVDNVSAPSKRLMLVTAISRKISALDQQQKSEAFKDPGNYKKLFKESAQLRKLLDSLLYLYAADSIQSKRITTIKKLLVERDRQFVNYLMVRERLVKNKTFSDRVKDLNAFLAKSSGKPDSTILATEHKTSTTTFSPKEEKSRSLLGRIFGKKKNEDAKSFTIVSEEKIKRDTIALAPQDERAKKLEKSLLRIETEQRQNSASFLNREATLAKANNRVIAQMLEVLHMVEHEVVVQIEMSSLQAKSVVNDGINAITLILLVFLVLTVALLYLILTDIAKSNRYRHQIEIAKDEAVYHSLAKQRFLANMSHEIRTPLQSIIGYTEVVLNDPQPSKKHIEAVQSASQHLLQIVNEVLDYNRIVSGKFEFNDEPFNMASLLNDVVSIVRPQAEGKALELVTDFELSGLPELSGDAFRLKQVLLNLLANAIKFTDNGKIQLSVNYKKKGLDNYFTFIVEDSGIGMSPDQTKIIFNEFEQVSQPKGDLEKQSGAGLGLSIIKALIENQNGRIYVKSTLGKGTAFTVYLNFTASEIGLQKTFSAGSATSKKSGKVWVIDDDPLILELCEIFFKTNGIDFKSFSSPITLLASTLTEDVSHILMDIRMPGMSGEELCQRIRSTTNSKLNIIAVTAQVMPEEKEHLLNSGFDGVIAKPFTMKQLIDAVSDPISVHIINQPELLDFKQLEKMTYGDAELLKKIAERFSEDSRHDSKLVINALKSSDMETLSLVLHRLAGRIAQVGAAALAAEFRTMELTVARNAEPLAIVEHEQIIDLLEELNAVIIAVESHAEIGYSMS